MIATRNDYDLVEGKASSNLVFTIEVFLIRASQMCKHLQYRANVLNNASMFFVARLSSEPCHSAPQKEER